MTLAIDDLNIMQACKIQINAKQIGYFTTQLFNDIFLNHERIQH